MRTDQLTSNNTVFYDCEKNETSFHININWMSSATTHQIARIYFFPIYTKCWEWEPSCKLNGGRSRFQHCLPVRGRYIGQDVELIC